MRDRLPLTTVFELFDRIGTDRVEQPEAWPGVADVLDGLSFRLGCRSIDGLVERAVYREFFPRGLTALDDLDQANLGTRPNAGHIAARKEVTDLLNQLKLPLDERGRRRAANRAEWFAQIDKPLKTFDIIDA